jgi:hypothetical protein
LTSDAVAPDGYPPEIDEHATSYATVEDGSLLHGGALVFFDGPLERLDLVRAAARAASAHEELRRRPTAVPLAGDVLAWSVDAGFRAGRQVQVVDLDDGRNDAVLLKTAAHLWSRPLPADRPPWQLTLLCGRRGEPAVVLLKAHRALLDGCGGAALAALLLGAGGDPGERPLRAVKPPARGLLPALLGVASNLAEQGARRSRALATEVRALMRPGIALARTREVGRILESAGTLLSSPAPETPWNAPLGSERDVAWLALPRDVLRGIEEVFGGTWEDAWLTIVADAFGRHLRGRGRSTIGLTLLAYLPRDPDGADRAHGLAAAPDEHPRSRLIGLPVDEMAPAARHAAVLNGHGDRVAAARGAGLEQLARLSHRLPAPLQSLLGSLCYQAANTVLVAERTPAQPILVGERSATSLVPLAPLPWHVGLAVAALARDHEVSIGVTADAALVPHLDAFVLALRDAYVELAAAAGVPPLDPPDLRRPPAARSGTLSA